MNIIFNTFLSCTLFFAFTSWNVVYAEYLDRFHFVSNHSFAGLNKENEGNWKGPFCFVQLADCQLGMYEEDRSWNREVEQLEQAVEMINIMHPRFVIVCGDLTNATPEKPSHPGQVADFKRVMSHVAPDIPLVCVCGNHDVGNTPTTESISSYVNNFGDHYFSFWVSGTHCLVLNSNLFVDDTMASDLQKEQLAWMDQELENKKTSPPIHRIVFTHHPWFLHHANEEDHYFAIPKAIRLPTLDKFLKAGVTVCFAGHYHRNALGSYRGMEMVTTSAVGMPLGNDLPGFRVVRVFRDRIEHEYVELATTLNLQEELSASMPTTN